MALATAGPAPTINTQQSGEVTQVCTASMRVGLVGYWNFTGSPATTIAAGTPQGVEIDLTLSRTSRTTGSILPAAEGWTLEPAALRQTYNGMATAELPAGLSLAEDGQGVTVAVRAWLRGGDVQGGSGPLANDIQLVGLAGQWSPTEQSGIALVVPDPKPSLLTPSAAEIAIRQWTGGSYFQFTVPGSRAFSTPMLAVMTLQRTMGAVLATCFINGQQAGPGVWVISDLIDLTRIVFGDIDHSDGSISQAAVWNRALLATEIAGLAGDLQCVHGVQTEPPVPTPEEWPLLNDDGRTTVHPERIVPLEHGHGVLSAVGGIRHTRAVHERRPRRYGLRMRLGNGAEAITLSDLIRTTRMGAMWTRWRHPVDDPPGPPETAPRWWCVNLADGSLSLNRSGGGAIGDFTLVLQEI